MPVLTYRRGFRYLCYDFVSNMFLFEFVGSGVRSGYQACKYVGSDGCVYFMTNGKVTDSEGTEVSVL